MREWRLIIDLPRGGHENMAIDEAIFYACQDGLSPSTVRFYGWIQPTLSLGFSQKVVGLYVSRCQDLGIPVVRRITGGGAVLHDKELTYSIICKRDEPLFREGILGAYRIISGCFVSALKGIGVKAESRVKSRESRVEKNEYSCFHTPSRFEVVVEGKKLIGSAQKRSSNAFLQHGSILFDVDVDKFNRVFEEGPASGVTWIYNYNREIELDWFRRIIVREIERGLGIRLRRGELTPIEVLRKEERE
ncbi:MAG: lipoate--protein ligase family protein, partial [Deltaproteobacteria bacterium]|nr:lipoate--protein ligase family protein [Deltaproteobacteria bacterium]